MSSSHLPRIVATRRVFNGWNTLDIVSLEAEGANGTPARSEREVIDHGNAAVVLAVDRQRDVAILVRQLRAPLLISGGEPMLLEACAGIIDEGETPEQTARREADEEIGFKVEALRHVTTVAPSAGTLTERMHLYVAEVSEAERSSRGGGKAAEGEAIEVVEVGLGDLFGMAKRGEILDAKTLILVQHLMIASLERRALESPAEA